MATPPGRPGKHLDSAFAEALKKQEEQKKKLASDLDELSRLAEEGRRAGRRAGMIAAVIAGLVLVAVLIVMLKDPVSRGISIFFLCCLVFLAVWKFWKAAR